MKAGCKVGWEVLVFVAGLVLCGVVRGSEGEVEYRMFVKSWRVKENGGVRREVSFEYEWDFVASAKEVEGGVRVKGRTKRFELKALEMKVPFWGGGGDIPVLEG